MRSPPLLRILLIAAAALAAALGIGSWWIHHRAVVRTVYRDRDSLRLDAAAVRVRKVLWNEPADLPRDAPAPGAEPVRLPASPDSFILVAAPSSRGDMDICLRLRAPDGWGPPAPLRGAEGTVNTRASELHAVLSPGGDLLLFASDRPGGHGALDLWCSARAADGWDEPRNLGLRVNSPYDEHSPAFSPDGGAVVFATNRPRSFLLRPPEEWAHVFLERWPPGADNLALTTAARGEGGRLRWSRPAPLGALNTDHSETSPAFSPAGDFIYFASDRPGGSGDFDLYRARLEPPPAESEAGRAALRFGPAENLLRPLNTEGPETSPRLLDGGFRVVYRRNRPSAKEEALAESLSREVEERIEIAELPVASFAWRAVRILALAAATLAMALAIVVLVRTRRRWATNLLVRCGAAAVLIHAGMLYGFYFWKVSSEILAAAKEEPTEITLERTLSTRITLDAGRQAIEVPEPAAAREPAQPLMARDDVERMASPPPEAVVLARAPAAVLEPRPFLDAALLERPSVEPPPGPETPPSEAELRPRPAPATALPSPPVPEPQPAPLVPEPRPRSVKVERELRETASVEMARVLAAGPLESDAESGSQLAATAVQGPQPADLLPPVARAPSFARAELSSRTLPAQSPPAAEPEPSLEPPQAEPAAEPALIASLSAPPSPEPSPPTRLEMPEASWESMPSGIPATADLQDIDARLAAAPLPADRRATPVASTRRRLPEPAPLGETSAEAAGSADELLAGLQPSPPGAPRFEPRPAILRSPVAAAAARPLTHAEESAPAVTAAVLARLEPRSAPGRLLAEPLRPLPDPSRAYRLPAPAEAGGPEAADILDPTPPAPSSERRSFEPAAPREPLPEIEPVEPIAAAAERGPSAASAIAAAAPGETALDRAAPPAAVDPADLAPAEMRSAAVQSAASIELPESRPESLGRVDLRQVRRSESRRRLIEEMGGSQASESAVELALRWLARHQSPDGRWDVDGFDRYCGSCTSFGVETDCDAAITGLVILCFLGHNHRPDGADEYAPVVGRALAWLIGEQDAAGSLAGRDRKFVMYSHAIATLALSEAYLMTRDERYRRPLRPAAELIVRAQNPTTGGWRYRAVPPIQGDTSIAGWQVMALRSVEQSGIRVPEAVFDRARHWLDEEVAGGLHGGIYSYRPLRWGAGPDEEAGAAAVPTQVGASVSMTAEGMYARILLGARRGDARVEESARYIHSRTRDDSVHLNSLYLLYYGTLALYNYQGWIWEEWNREVREFLIARQRRDGTLIGSWDPLDIYMEPGGRVLATAFATLTLEVYYRYLPLYWSPDRGWGSR